mmetsp:Transcript_3478/g.9956  ORF Transcript_3478/g.9956 Transcript_3478/m.9956 type:complete len:235 (-) Transcript_3478:116-820(-)
MFGCCCTTEDEGSGVATISTLQMAEVTTDANKEVDAVHQSMAAEETAAIPAVEPAAEPDSAPALPENTFTAKLTRDNIRQPLGLSVEQFVPNALYISKVDEDGTAVGEYNAKAPEDQRFQAGQYIVSVDTLLGASAVDRMVQVEAATIVLKRPKVFEVALARNGLPLGIMLKYDSLGASVYVKGIEDSGAAKAAGSDILVGDRIVSVNGVGGSPAVLMEELKKSEKVVLAISRQ